MNRSFRATYDALVNWFYTFTLRITLVILAGDILFTNGFMLLRFPPVGAGVPINQILLVFCLAALLFTRQPTAGFSDTTLFLPLAALWLHSGVQLASGTYLEGIWAIRDAANIIETGFLFIGFCLASDRRFLPIFIGWFRRVFTFAAMYILLFPAQNSLIRFSPAVPSMSGYQAPILFSYGNPNSIGVTSACFLLLSNHGPRLFRLLLAAVLLMALVVFVQARIVYLQIAFLLALVLLFQPQRLTSLGQIGLAAIVFAALFLASGIELPGRLGRTFSLDFLTNHIQAIWGGGDDSISAAAEGVDLRLGWWLEIHENLQQDLRTWFLGLGYGIPLTSFRGPSDDIVREPHNSFFSIYGRLGIVGICLFLLVQALILKASIELVIMTRRGAFRELHVTAITMLCFLGVHLIYSLAEGGMEVSFIAVPYYFFSGVILALRSSPRLCGIRSGHGRVMAASRPADPVPMGPSLRRPHDSTRADR